MSKECTCVRILNSITEIPKIYYLMGVKRFVIYISTLDMIIITSKKNLYPCGVRILYDLQEFVSSTTTTPYLLGLLYNILFWYDILPSQGKTHHCI